MTKTIELTDDQYETITKVAESRGQTASALLAQLIEGLRDPYSTPHYFTDDEFLRHLGMSDGMVRKADILATNEDEAADVWRAIYPFSASPHQGDGHINWRRAQLPRQKGWPVCRPLAGLYRLTLVVYMRCRAM